MSDETRTCALPGCGIEFTPARKTQKYHAPSCGKKASNARHLYGAQPGAPEAAGGDVQDISDRALMEALARRGMRVVTEDIARDRVHPGPPDTHGRLRVGVVSDTHLGSRYQQLSHLHDMYDRFERAGITEVWHVGDLVHGSHKMHRDMPFELHVHGFDAQVTYAVENYPRIPGIKTRIISGNHDLSHYNDIGADPVAAFARERDDVEYLGQVGAFINVADVARVYLQHPRGGGSYAKSYRLQKLIENFDPAKKPNVLLIGHYHNPAHVPAYRNVEGIMLPAFQAQTRFERELGLWPVTGGLILDVGLSENGIEDFGVEWHLFRVPVPNDY